jgi:hypothetical protein
MYRKQIGVERFLSSRGYRRKEPYERNAAEGYAYRLMRNPWRVKTQESTGLFVG